MVLRTRRRLFLLSAVLWETPPLLFSGIYKEFFHFNVLKFPKINMYANHVHYLDWEQLYSYHGGDGCSLS